METGARNVVKNLAAAEDIVHGVGTIQQTRNGEVYQVRRVDIPLGLASEAELSTVDPVRNPRVRAGSVQYDYVNGAWQKAIDIRPYQFVAGVTLTETNRYVIQGNVIARYIGVTPYIISASDDINNAGKFEILAGGGGGTPTPVEGGGIIYSNELPAIIKPEDTYANFESMEVIYSYQDSDSTQYLAIPMLAGSGGSNAAGGSGGYSTFASASPDGSLVALGSTDQDHRIKGILPGTGITIDSTGTALVINATASGGGTGNGIVYSNTLPSTLVAGTTYANFETMELVFTYNDGTSTQYLPIPMVGSGAAASGGSGGGGSFFNISNAGSSADGAEVMFTAIDTYYLRRFKPSEAANITITASGNSIVLEPTIYANAGTTGAVLLKAKAGNTIGVKRLVQGTGVTLTEGTDTVTIAATGGGGATLGDALTRINSLTPENNNIMVWTAAGVTQFLSTASTRAMMGLSTIANTIPMFTGTTTATLATLTPFMKTLLEKTGVPTALQHLKITSGSNANGGWLRIGTGDTAGVQICWHTIVCNGTNTAVGGGFMGPNASWTYPQAFNGIPAVSGTLQDGVQAWITNGSTGNSSTAASFRQMSFINATSNVAVGVMAIGFY